ncbi:MAG: hypothetical protein OEW73_02870 [Gammaproteobacteria bacterium]|nr:hypothetical protein [Gammaproteobacteria bacterium]MDH5582267.1 hypothetical protein [Gammaproteobacteria bacterium]
MPEINVIHIGIIAASTVIGAIVAWILRGKRSQQEKAAVSRGWQEQINAQRLEHDRLVDQNKGLMEQISQYLASNQDAKNRAKELSLAVQEAYARRDALQREIKDIRSNLEVTIAQRNQLKSDISSRASDDAKLEKKDAQIRKLQRELDNWQNRLPPLIEKFRLKNEEAEQLRAELAAAHARVAELEVATDFSQTRIEPVRDPDTLTDGRDASNDPDDSDDAEDLIDVDAMLEDDTDPETAASAADNDDDDDEEYEDEILAVDDETEDESEDEDEGEDEGDEPINGSRDQLQAIKGVGPAIEKTLNEMGIFSYQQIADMSEYDIDRIARRLKGFRSRIYREDWIGQARELRDQKQSG